MRALCLKIRFGFHVMRFKGKKDNISGVCCVLVLKMNMH